MFNLLMYAVPFFLALLAVEWISFRHIGEHANADPGEDPPGRLLGYDTSSEESPAGLLGYDTSSEESPAGLLGYDRRDTATSLAMGLGNMVVNTGWKIAVAAVYTAVYEVTPLRIPSDAIWAWVLLFVCDDLAFYWYHRVSHESRLFWGSHVVHHSSERYNLSTALRQPWVPMTSFMFWIPLAAVGFKPWMILLQQAISLTYQFFIHTEKVGKLPRPVEFVLNTPSHHRGHHGSNEMYLDRNYGGITILWDRLFRTFQAETERVRYGLTTNIETFNPIKVAGHEYAAMIRDVIEADSWGDRFGFVFRRPGWAYARRAATGADRRALKQRVASRAG